MSDFLFKQWACVTFNIRFLKAIYLKIDNDTQWKLQRQKNNVGKEGLVA